MVCSGTRPAALLVALAVVAAACGDDSGDGDGADGTDAGGADSQPVEIVGLDGANGGDGCEETVAGTELTYGVYAPASEIDPTLASGALVGGTELLAVYDSLLVYDYESEDWEPHLAEGITSNEDHTVWTLELREDVTYSDGTPLTAELVAENHERFFDDGATNTSAGFMTPIVETTVVDEHTLEFELDRSWAEFPFVLADEPGMIVNTDAIGDDADAFAAQPPDAAGLGPYVVERNAPGEELVLEARDDYWGGPVCIERLRFVFTPDATLEAFDAGDLDMAFLRDPGDIQEAREADHDRVIVLQDSGEALMINHAEGRPGEDPRVREAMMLAVDEEVINEQAFEGHLTASKSLVVPGSRFHSDDIEPYPTDPDRAADLVEEAREDGFDGQVELLCTTSPAQRPDTGLAVEGMLENVGFDVELTNLEQSDQIGRVVQEDFDIACWGFNAGPDTGTTTFNRILASDSASNRADYGSDAMDAALLDLFAAEDGEARRSAMAEVSGIFDDDAVALPYGHIEEGAVWTDEVQGIVPTGATMFMFHDAYLEG